ncbi:OsmC family protein [bacterium]|nr:OsmC family protein [bacterium]
MSKTIDVLFAGEKKVNARIGNFEIQTDQSLKNGGGGSAPEPFQLFLSSIATCAGIYAYEFCRTRQIDMTGMSLKMVCDFDPEVKRYTKIIFDLTLPNNFPEKYIKGIQRAMDLCSVKRYMMDPPEFDSVTRNNHE